MLIENISFQKDWMSMKENDAWSDLAKDQDHIRTKKPFQPWWSSDLALSRSVTRYGEARFYGDEELVDGQTNDAQNSSVI